MTVPYPIAPTWTSPSEYRSRSCNQCGQCCEAFSLPYKPLELVRGTAAKRFTARIQAWLPDVVPLDAVNEWGQQLYSCLRFERDGDGRGRCTRYDDRPETCARYPFGFHEGDPVAPPIYPQCSWYVNVIPIRGKVAAEPNPLVKSDQPSSAAPHTAEAVG